MMSTDSVSLRSAKDTIASSNYKTKRSKNIIFPFTQTGQALGYDLDTNVAHRHNDVMRFLSIVDNVNEVEERGAGARIKPFGEGTIPTPTLHGRDWLIYTLDFGCLKGLYSEEALVVLNKYNNDVLIDDVKQHVRARENEIKLLEGHRARFELIADKIQYELIEVYRMKFAPSQSCSPDITKAENAKISDLTRIRSRLKHVNAHILFLSTENEKANAIISSVERNPINNPLLPSLKKYIKNLKDLGLFKRSANKVINETENRFTTPVYDVEEANDRLLQMSQANGDESLTHALSVPVLDINDIVEHCKYAARGIIASDALFSSSKRKDDDSKGDDNDDSQPPPAPNSDPLVEA